MSDAWRDWYRNRRVVVTGGYGYLGTGLSARLRDMGAHLRRATRGRVGIANDTDAWVGELTDPDFCARLVSDVDAIFHMSGQTSIKASFDDPVGDVRANVESTVNLLTACARAGHAPSFAHAGTATEIGLTLEVPIAPGTPDLPISVYDADKLAAEQMIGVYTASKAVAGATLRIANVFGHGAEKSAADRGVTNKMIAHAMSGQDLTYYGDGQLIRDYVYIDDLLDAFLRFAPAAGRANRRSYIVSGGKGYALRDAFNLIADVVADLGHRRVNVLSAPWPTHVHPIDRRSFVGDIRPLTELCGWHPMVSLREGIRLTAIALAHNAQQRQNG